MRAYTIDTIHKRMETCMNITSLREIHACILTRGFGGTLSLVSRLLSRYVGIGSLLESRQAFDRIVDRDIYLWNSAIVGYFRGGHFVEVLRLYLNLKLVGIGVDSSSITFGLKSCMEFSDVRCGRRIHADAYKGCFHVGKFVGSSLADFYSRCGDVEGARRAFEEIVVKDIVAYTTMITCYARLSDSRVVVAFDVARDVMKEGLCVNRVTLVSLLQAAGQMEALKEGRSIHCYALRRGIDQSDGVLETSLVDLYSRCGAAIEAASLLTRSERTTVASWNAMIAGLVHRDQWYEALKYFSLIDQEKLTPDLVTIAHVITACLNLNSHRDLTSIHGYLFRRELPLDMVAATILIDAYSKCDKIKYARQLFDRLLARDMILYTVMISGYLLNGRLDEAVKMFNNMGKEGVRPNSATVLCLVSAFAELSDIRIGGWIHGFVIKSGLQSDVNVSNQILHMYAKCSLIDMARNIFDLTIEKDLASWTTMMMGYIGFGRTEEVLALFRLMQGTKIKPDSVALVTVLQALSHLGCLRRIKEIHGYIHRTMLASDTDTNNTLIIAYSKCGFLRSSQDIFNSMPERSLASWNSMIAAYGMHGYCKQVLKVFDQMQRENMKPDGVTLTSLLSACSHAGLVEEAWNIFCSMDDMYSVSPQEEHYGCMVDLLGRAGQLEEAYDFVMCSPPKNGTSTLCALLAACRIHGNTKLGEVIGRQLIDLEPENSRNYTLVSSIYAQSNKWSEYAELRSFATERGLSKVPGYSLIQSGMNHERNGYR